MTTTPLMNLDLPVVGPTGTTGPEWASQLNEAFEDVDSHDHTTGKGTQIPTAGINVNSDLTFNNYNATDVNSVRLKSQSAALATSSDKNCVYSVNGNMFWNNGSGTAVQLTSGSGINLASTGTIGGDYGQPGVNAAVTYSNTTKVFSFTQSSGVTAKMSFGDILLSKTSSGEQPITISAPTGVSSYAVTLPAAQAAANDSALVFDTSGTGAFKAITGTANQVVVTSSSTGLAFSLPQSIATSSSVTFGAAAITGALSAGTINVNSAGAMKISYFTGTLGTTATITASGQIYGAYGYFKGTSNGGNQQGVIPAAGASSITSSVYFSNVSSVSGTTIGLAHNIDNGATYYVVVFHA